MRKLSVTLMAAFALAMGAISCSPERQLFADATAQAGVRPAEAR